MNAISDFWARGGAELRASFERTRQAQKDSHIKGGANEQALARFLRENLGANRVALSSSIIDPSGAQSDEVDVAVVNQYQPLWTCDSNQVLIAHAVDAAYQVKARLSTEELRRAIRNARSVKQLVRPGGGQGRETFIAPADKPRFVDRIPYFIFAYTTNVTGEAAIKLLREELDGVPWYEQPDGIFVLDDWAAINVGDNDGMNRLWPAELRGLTLTHTDEQSALAQMLWTHCGFVPLIVYRAHPIRLYHPFPDRPSEHW
ncbi:hypothetical protein AO501_19385 [Mycobacterium gordonae]|uniref:DUF6602 domain-containing protein n=1 Tax=Mycobacterium gordonae TaxID=1778 RepID=A0A0Q2U2K2_MYCGO|nr:MULTISPECIES: DUF6602 domain-containing protein [Mycobacterium]KQH75040.1 hypothetical protein AO501_19385 [Mycobacterium gordonae]MDP7728937.1 hypothetical protein [Mycobacterium sp. TY813]